MICQPTLVNQYTHIITSAWPGRRQGVVSCKTRQTRKPRLTHPPTHPQIRLKVETKHLVRAQDNEFPSTHTHMDAATRTQSFCHCSSSRWSHTAGGELRGGPVQCLSPCRPLLLRWGRMIGGDGGRSIEARSVPADGDGGRAGDRMPPYDDQAEGNGGDLCCEG